MIGSRCSLRELADALDRVVGPQGRVHQLDAVEAGIAHVGEDLRQDGRDVVVRQLGGVDPGMGPHDDLAAASLPARPAGISPQRPTPARLPSNRETRVVTRDQSPTWWLLPSKCRVGQASAVPPESAVVRHVVGLASLDPPYKSTKLFPSRRSPSP